MSELSLLSGCMQVLESTRLHLHVMVNVKLCETMTLVLSSNICVSPGLFKPSRRMRLQDSCILNLNENHDYKTHVI